MELENETSFKKYPSPCFIKSELFPVINISNVLSKIYMDFSQNHILFFRRPNSLFPFKLTISADESASLPEN